MSTNYLQSLSTFSGISCACAGVLISLVVLKTVSDGDLEA